MKCITDFDQIRFECVDGPRPAQRVQRQTVIERAGNQPTLNRGKAAGRVRVVLAGHDQAVSPVGMRAHPFVLGEQVAFHSTAGR
jgi:hypothetical protein